MKKFTLFTILMLTFFSALAADQIGSIVKYTGRVTVFDGVSPRGTDVEAAAVPVMPGNIIMTNRTSTAVILMNTGDRIALSENSKVTFTDTGRYDPKNGKSVYKITKRGTANGLKVGLKTAVIGVKGTEFLIDIDDSGESKVYLKDGNISVDAMNGDFIKHNAIEIDEYAAFVAKLTGEYDKYLEDLHKEYTEYVKSFTMSPGQAVVIDGNDVSDIQFTKDLDTYFNMVDE